MPLYYYNTPDTKITTDVSESLTGSAMAFYEKTCSLYYGL